MAPLNNVAEWPRRTVDSEKQLDPKNICYVICEGERSEDFYFKALLRHLNSSRVEAKIKAIYLEKTGVDAHASHPKRLLELAQGKLRDSECYPGDSVAIVFDADVFKAAEDEYLALLDACEACAIKPVVTYPSFEVFLMLHVEDAVRKYMYPNRAEILENKRSGKRKYVKQLCSRVTGCNPGRVTVGRLAQNVSVAISEEKQLNQDERRAIGEITSTVGAFVEMLIMDDEA